MKLCESIIPPLMVFHDVYDMLAVTFGWLTKDSSEEDRLRGYSNICAELLETGQSLAEFLMDSVKYSDSPIFAKTVKEPTEFRKKALAYDLSVLKQLVKTYTAPEIKKALAVMEDATADYADYASLPEFESGTFDLTAAKLLKFAAKNGTGDFAKYRAFGYKDGELSPIENIDPITLSDLKNYELQRDKVVENTEAFLSDLPAQNVLLYGDRGCGKSSTIKALLNEYDGLRMIELPKSEVHMLPELFAELKESTLHFIVTIDDLSFSEDDERFGVLKSALDGGLAAKPENVLIYSTTNRRKLIKETRTSDEISKSDAVDESMSLADRFGLFITFTQPDREEYLDIVRQIAADKGLDVDEDEFDSAAERFAIRHSGRSPRIARQFVDYVISRVQLGLDY